MTAHSSIIPSGRPATSQSLPQLVSRAARALASAESCAEVLEARDMATGVYDAAKKAARMAQAKGAHDALIAAAHRAQADALVIEAEAKRRLADEYDAAQERGEVRADRQRTASSPEAVTAPQLGLTHKQVHEARQIRDAEQAQPGIVKETLDRAIADRREPTRAEMQRSVLAAVAQARKTPKVDRSNPHRVVDHAYDRVVWFSGMCEELAEAGAEVEKIARYDGLESTIRRLHRNADAASAVLSRFMEVRRA